MNKRLITLDISPATATHCTSRDGVCDYYIHEAEHCIAFGDEVEHDKETGYRKRLPECIAAEKAQKENR